MTMGRIRTVRPLVATAIFLLLAAAPGTLGLRVNLSASMPRGLYRAAAGEPRLGDVVAACVPEGAALLARERGYLGVGGCLGGVQPVVKTVAALAGSRIAAADGRIEVDGRLLPASAVLPTDRAGRPLAPFLVGPVRLATGEVWLHSGHHGRSWDSRYFGPVPRRAVLSVYRPLWTFG